MFGRSFALNSNVNCLLLGLISFCLVFERVQEIAARFPVAEAASFANKFASPVVWGNYKRVSEALLLDGCFAEMASVFARFVGVATVIVAKFHFCKRNF